MPRLARGVGSGPWRDHGRSVGRLDPDSGTREGHRPSAFRSLQTGTWDWLALAWVMIRRAVAVFARVGWRHDWRQTRNRQPDESQWVRVGPDRRDAQLSVEEDDRGSAQEHESEHDPGPDPCSSNLTGRAHRMIMSAASAHCPAFPSPSASGRSPGLQSLGVPSVPCTVKHVDRAYLRRSAGH